MTKASEAELTVWQRSFAAGTSSAMSAVLCNPLEVVKVRTSRPFQVFGICPYVLTPIARA